MDVRAHGTVRHQQLTPLLYHCSSEVARYCYRSNLQHAWPNPPKRRVDVHAPVAVSTLVARNAVMNYCVTSFDSPAAELLSDH